jgi:hypothetical protein
MVVTEADDEVETVIERKADSKGRVAIGTEYAGEEVRIAVLATTDWEHPDGVPDRCAACGGAIGGRFVFEQGSALHVGCSDVEEPDAETEGSA